MILKNKQYDHNLECLSCDEFILNCKCNNMKKLIYKYKLLKRLKKINKVKNIKKRLRHTNKNVGLLYI